MKEGHVHFTEQRDSTILSSPGLFLLLLPILAEIMRKLLEWESKGHFPSLFLKSDKWILVTAYSRWLPRFHYVYHHRPWVHRLYYLSSAVVRRHFISFDTKRTVKKMLLFPFYRQERSPAFWAGAKPGYESMGLGARDPSSLHSISEKSRVSSA